MGIDVIPGERKKKLVFQTITVVFIITNLDSLRCRFMMSKRSISIE